jgi:prepilin-type N-terminal cleavage/methylation domain-containing protein
MPSLRFASAQNLFSRAREEAGFTLVEVLVAVVVLTVGLLGTFAVLRTSAHTTLTNRERQAETSLAREVLEDAGALPAWQLSSSAPVGSSQPLATALQSLIPGAGAPVGNVLQVTRGPASYRVTVTACAIDDPSDGVAGSHVSLPAPNRAWCPNLLTSGSPDATPDNEEQVSVTVAPSADPSGPTVQQSTLIVNRAPVVSSVTAGGGTCTAGPPVSCTSAQPITVSVTTTRPATLIRWFVNGGSRTTYTTTGTTSQFTWTPPHGAATYTISAQAEYGQGPWGSAATQQIAITS